ncbi:testis-specific serine/threonine-protein kinase 6-like [Salminus brasiliensis]|uniref:testis-specific serine/threonine-protein kinase 6-like n=1 Tax=Salminus brasiliensis TaxID=930266 RepID=UPI003B839861
MSPAIASPSLTSCVTPGTVATKGSDSHKGWRLGYEVLGNLGKGGFGQVKLATSERHPKQVAVKVMDRRRGSAYFVSKLLPRELTLLRTVKHPHIVEVHDILELDNGLVFIVMEAATTNLNGKIQELGHISIPKARGWFSQLLSAVVYLHQQDIVHRDIKCENVLLTADNRIKLTDFGLGRFYKGLPDLSGTFCCTQCYAAPEVIMQEPYDPKKSDVWSLGVVLYVMVTGSMPFINLYKHLLPRLQRKAVSYPAWIRAEEPCRSAISYMLRYNPFTRPTVREVQQHPWLQSSRVREKSQTADSSVTEAPSSLEVKVFETPRKHSREYSEDRQQQEEKEEEQKEEQEQKEQKEQPSAEVEEGKDDLEWSGLSSSSGLLDCDRPRLFYWTDPEDEKEFPPCRHLARLQIGAGFDSER